MKKLLLYQYRSEFRRKSAFFSLLFFLISLVFINYLALGIHGPLAPGIWSALFWMVLLSALVNTVGKGFIAEKGGLTTYFYSLASPVEIIMSKVIYGFFLCSAISLTGFAFFSLWLSNPIAETGLFLITLLLTSFGFSASLSLLSAIASKTNNSSMIMAILSFPVIIGILLMAIQITKNCIDGLDLSASWDEVLTLGAINVMVTSVSYLLFPYIWRS